MSSSSCSSFLPTFLCLMLCHFPFAWRTRLPFLSMHICKWLSVFICLIYVYISLYTRKGTEFYIFRALMMSFSSGFHYFYWECSNLIVLWQPFFLSLLLRFFSSLNFITLLCCVYVWFSFIYPAWSSLELHEFVFFPSVLEKSCLLSLIFASVPLYSFPSGTPITHILDCLNPPVFPAVFHSSQIPFYLCDSVLKFTVNLLSNLLILSSAAKHI